MISIAFVDQCMLVISLCVAKKLPTKIDKISRMIRFLKSSNFGVSSLLRCNAYRKRYRALVKWCNKAVCNNESVNNNNINDKLHKRQMQNQAISSTDSGHQTHSGRCLRNVGLLNINAFPICHTHTHKHVYRDLFHNLFTVSTHQLYLFQTKK